MEGHIAIMVHLEVEVNLCIGKMAERLRHLWLLASGLPPMLPRCLLRLCHAAD